MRCTITGLGLAATAALFVLAGCASIGERIVASGQRFSIATGEQVRLVDGTALEYRRVLADSRCRPDVQCIWAGRAELEFHVTPPPALDGAESATSELLLATDADSIGSYGGWEFQLVDLGFEPQPEASLRANFRGTTR